MAKEKKDKKKKKSKNSKTSIGKKKGIIILVIALIVSIGTIVVSKVILWPKYQAFKENRKKEQVEEASAKQKEMGKIYEMEEIRVNTYKSGGRRFALIQLSLETHNDDVLEELEKRNPQIRNLLIKYFRAKTVADLTHPSFTDSSASVLVDEINSLLNQGKISNLFYQDLLIQ